MYTLVEDDREESGCDEDEEEEETREEEEFDSDESLVDSDSDSEEKGAFWDAFVTNVLWAPFIHTNPLTCGCSSLSEPAGRSGRPDVWDRDQAEAHRWAGEQPAAAPHAEEPVWGEADSASEQDQRHTAGERPRAAQPQWAALFVMYLCDFCHLAVFYENKVKIKWKKLQNYKNKMGISGQNSNI